MPRYRIDEATIYDHYQVVEMFRDRCGDKCDVTPSKASEDGSGRIFLREKRSGDATVVKYHLPEPVRRIEDQCVLAMRTLTADRWTTGQPEA